MQVWTQFPLQRTADTRYGHEVIFLLFLSRYHRQLGQILGIQQSHGLVMFISLYNTRRAPDNTN